METFKKRVSYHETDKMGIVHHSNYVKWMEDARVDFLERIGAPFEAIEDMGILSPVVGVFVEYKTPMRFGETVEVEPRISVYNGVRLEVKYVMRNAGSGEVAAVATSKHCFTKDGRICSLKKAAPEIHAKLEGCLFE